MSVDFREVEEFAKDLGHQGAKVVLAQRQVVKKGALNVKRRLQAEAQGVAHAPGFPRAITFDVGIQVREIVADIGPEKGDAGSLALLYLGNSKTGPRLPEPMLAADARGEIVADIGPEKGDAGSLALLYLGNSKTGPRLPEPMLAADAEAEVMADFLGKVAEDIGR